MNYFQSREIQREVPLNKGEIRKFQLFTFTWKSNQYEKAKYKIILKNEEINTMIYTIGEVWSGGFDIEAC